MGSINMSDVLNNFENKKVFITGHTGFKGTWLSFLLRELGADVMGYALSPEPGPNHFDLLNLSDRLIHAEGDIRNADKLRKAINDFQPEYVFHLAAQALVKRSYDDPAATFESNVMGSVNLLDAVRECESIRSLVYITSDKCYENHEWIWGYRENDMLGGHDPYSASKAAAEIVFSAYSRSFFTSRPELGAASTRAGNVIGGGDWAADRIIPDCIKAIDDNKPIYLRNPAATRPWQHVLEPISGYLMLAAKLYDNPQEFKGSWNFGPSSTDVRTVQEVAEIITKYLGRGKIEMDTSKKHHHEANLLQLNCDKAHQLLDWYPRWDADKTLEATAQWYRAYFDGDKAEDITRKQLQDYFPELL